MAGEADELIIRVVSRTDENISYHSLAVRLWILLTQGSYDVNDKVLAVTPADVGVTYYDGD